MIYTANITPARFKAKAIYMVAPAYRRLKDGPVDIIPGQAGGPAFIGTLISCNGGSQGFLTCPDLYKKTSSALPLLPLQLSDHIEYEISGPAVRIVSIRRTGVQPSRKALSSPRHAPHPPLGPKSPPSTLAPSATGLPAYLARNAARIAALPPQILPKWSSAYNGRPERVMKRLYKRFPTCTIQRADVVTLYKDWSDPELALVATMVWGGINATRPRKSGHTDLENMLTHCPESICTRMNHIRDLLIDNNLRQSFLDCSAGGNSKINGVASSFFTKVFFFISEALGSKPTPLVLDKWTKNAFFLLLVQSGGLDAAMQRFRLPKRSEFLMPDHREMPLKGGAHAQADAYLDYVTRMNSWAVTIGVAPGQLEQFVFGEDLRRNPDSTNPRMEIVNQILPLLP